MSYLKIKNLKQKLDNFTLHVEDLEIQKGSFFGVLGNSGAGKSTFLNLLCGLEIPDEGEVFLEDEDITNIPSHKREIAYVFQNSLLFEGLSVKENLEYLLKAKGIDKNRYKDLVQTALCDCEASKLEKRDVNTLSGGEKQRVALAMALMFKPKLLILDEPFSNLDSSLQVRMREFLKSLIKKYNITAIMVTHDKEDAYELFDEMILLESGKIIQRGTPKNLYENPISIKCARYFGLENIFHGSIKEKIFTCKDLSLHVNHEDMQNAVIIIPISAIYVDKDEEEQSIISKTFVEGRWKNRLENGIVFYSQNELEKSIKLKINTKRVLIMEEEYA